MLTSGLLTDPNPNPNQIDKEVVAEEDHLKMENALVDSKHVTVKKEERGNPDALTKQKYLLDFLGRKIQQPHG